MLIDKADQLNLTVPEVTALVGGPHVLDANSNGSNHNVLTDNVGALSNNFFVNLLDMSTVWKKSAQESLYEGFNCKSRQKHYTCLLYTSPSPRDRQKSRMPSSA